MRQKKTSTWKLLLLMMLIIPFQLSAQVMNITGKVTDEVTGEPLPGVTIIIKGTATGAVTDFDGNYTIDADVGSTLSFSYIGYAPQEIMISDQKILNVQMGEETQSLDEVVVIGYGVQKKSDKTGSVQSIQADELNTGMLTDPYQAIQGKIAGVSISKKGGDPNAGFAIKIRGSSGFFSGTSPLVVVDGIPGVDITTVAPEDIASFNVLKDASSTAIYGSRGANGVIIIETKKGSSKASNVEFSSNVSIDQVAKKLDMLSADEVRQYVADNGLNFQDGGADTDWQDAIYRNGISQTYNLAASGGSENGSYRASLSHNDWTGVIKGSDKARTMGRINLNQKAMNGKLTISTSLAGTIEENNYISYGASGSNDVIYQALQRNPTDPIYNEDDSYYELARDFNYYNPVALIDQIQNNRDAKRFLGNLKADLEIVDGLVAGVNLGYTRDDYESWYFEPTDLRGGTTAGYGRRAYGNTESKVLETTLKYNTTINGIHNLNAVVGYSFQEDHHTGFSAQGNAPSSDLLLAYDISTLTEVIAGEDLDSYYTKNRLILFFGRVVYNYDRKYYATATLRRDGSTRFGANYPWGWFPSGSLAWNMKKEAFLSDIADISMMKLRIGAGISGNQEIGNFHSIAVTTAGGTTTNFETGESTTKYNLGWNANPELRWEKNAELNVGVDYGLWGNKVSGSIEYYYKYTYDLLAPYGVPVPPNVTQTTWANAGAILNQGLEFNVDYFVMNRPNFTWKTTLTFAKNNQKIKSLNSENGEYTWSENDKKRGWLSGRGLVGAENWTQVLEEDMSIGTFYMPEFARISDDGVPLFYTAAGGITRDLTQAERRVVGCALPDFEIGWSSYFTFFDNFDANISIRGVYGNDVLNVTRMVFENPTILPTLNTLSSSLNEDGLTSAPVVNSYYLEDASFLKIDNLSIGYKLNFKENEWIKNLRISINANNLYTLTGYSGLDPETSYDGLEFGLDMYNVYPKTRSISFGLKATF